MILLLQSRQPCPRLHRNWLIGIILQNLLINCLACRRAFPRTPPTAVAPSPAPRVTRMSRQQLLIHGHRRFQIAIRLFFGDSRLLPYPGVRLSKHRQDNGQGTERNQQQR
jgi:hypothetical protein